MELTTWLFIRVTRLANGPIMGPDLKSSIGVSIQGPSLICVPDWIEDRLRSESWCFLPAAEPFIVWGAGKDIQDRDEQNGSTASQLSVRAG